MIEINRKIKRLVPTARRAIVVTILPAEGEMAASIEVREKGRRGGFRVTLAGLHTILAQRAVEQRRRRPGVRQAVSGVGVRAR
jgi:hypothetical protein